MRKFTIEQASINVQWQYDRIAPALPLPGTEAFGLLCKRLAPFGLNANFISIDAPSNKLVDAVLTVVLLDGRLVIKFRVTSFEVIIDDFLDNDEQNLIDVCVALFEAMNRIDSDTNRGSAKIRVMYHLRLDTGENDRIIRDLFTGTSENSNLLPEVGIFKRAIHSDPALRESRVAIAKSLVFAEAIFVDLDLSYASTDDAVSLQSRVESDVFLTLRELGLVHDKAGESN